MKGQAFDILTLKKEVLKLAKAQLMLREQEEFVLSIKLSLAQLNKSFQETQS